MIHSSLLRQPCLFASTSTAGYVRFHRQSQSMFHSRKPLAPTPERSPLLQTLPASPVFPQESVSSILLQRPRRSLCSVPPQLPTIRSAGPSPYIPGKRCSL